MDELTCEKEVLQGELNAVTQAKIKLEDKNKELEDELKKWVGLDFGFKTQSATLTAFQSIVISYQSNLCTRLQDSSRARGLQTEGQEWQQRGWCESLLFNVIWVYDTPVWIRAVKVVEEC